MSRLWTQNANGVISDEVLAKMLKDYEKEQKSLALEIEQNQQTLSEANQKVTDLRHLLYSGGND